ncbi:PilZ domain-containing protein [Sphingomonas sp. BN140010]|uniref:PilZ domain-containing protein n=1 Tax=Sphingomonas arvum TaxID=2992113 RepID=A0ABT3JGW8_9SPHN|nr:PilZ domain-containing protein [Sphingomonas sp. BN140010]MCW3798269.1 PilZ domain-containing protein [Sphingomonas sp. BN140010]
MTGKFGKRIDGPAGRRQNPREELALEALVETVGARHSAAMLDLSQTGARLGGNDLPAAGDEMLLRVAGAALMGEVVWSTGEECGVRFDEPPTAGELQALRREGGADIARRLTPDERRAAEDWRHGLAR